MELLKIKLTDAEVRGVACSSAGEMKIFKRRGVVDLFSLITSEPTFLQGGKLVDRVIGRGAALLLVKGGVYEVYADVMSEGAFKVLIDAGIKASYGTLCSHIVNRTGDGMCPVEELTQQITDAEEAYILIKEFLIEKQIINR